MRRSSLKVRAGTKFQPESAFSITCWNSLRITAASIFN